MNWWRALVSVALALVIGACTSDPRSTHERSPVPSHAYELDCADLAEALCMEMAERFVADLRETEPGAVVIAVRFPFPDTIDATLSDGRHVSTTLEPDASDG